jgi:hypothetical protein
MRKHLLYHVYPKRSSGTWQACLDLLLSRIDLFDGRRVVAVATDSLTDSADAVRDYLSGLERLTVLEQPNDPMVREVATHAALWGTLKDEDGVAFYGHAKGVTRPPGAHSTAWRWYSLALAACLDHPRLVDALLTRFPAVGSLLKVGKCFPGSESAWHYSGSFYWLRLADVFRSDWERIDRDYSGIESWPSLHVRVGEAASVFGRLPAVELNLYDSRILAKFEGRYAEWASLQN